jgi:hypothetical protein
MTSITKRVWRIISEDPSLRKDLARGVINVSGLAVYLKRAYKLDGSLDSIISAIRRYKIDESVSEEHTAVSSALSDAVISTKTRITAIHLKNSTNLYKYLSDLMKDAEFYRSEIFRLIKGRNETLCLIDKESLSRAKGFFPEGNIVSVEHGLAELSLTLTKQGWQAKGLMARLTNEIANYGVNIVVSVSAEPRISIFIQEKDLTRAHEAALSLAR